VISEEQAIRTGNLIGGERREAASGRTFESRTPARHDEVIGVFPESSGADVDAAVAAAPAAAGPGNGPRRCHADNCGDEHSRQRGGQEELE